GGCRGRRGRIARGRGERRALPVAEARGGVVRADEIAGHADRQGGDGGKDCGQAGVHGRYLRARRARPICVPVYYFGVLNDMIVSALFQAGVPFFRPAWARAAWALASPTLPSANSPSAVASWAI